jgi:GT2 family glycosyltransferase
MTSSPESRLGSAAIAASVIVPTHRGSHRLPALLEALRRQIVSSPWEVVIVVDGVVDGTLDLVNAASKDLMIRRVVLQHSVGVSRALNAGYAAAAGRVLIRCDDDLTPAPEMVARHLAWHESPGMRGIIGPTRDTFEDTRYAQTYGRLANERALAAIYERPASDRWLHWAAHNSLTRGTWERVGGFDERFPYGEDSELGWRLAQAGVALHVDRKLEIEHRGPATTASSRVPRAFVAGASRRVFRAVHPEASYPDIRARGFRGRVWQTGTSLLARILRTREGFGRMGKVLDRVLPPLPSRVAGLLIGFTVESAGKSGARHGPDDLGALRAQKQSDLNAELNT